MKKTYIVSIAFLTVLVSCGERSRENLVDSATVAALQLKTCGDSACADDPCSTKERLLDSIEETSPLHALVAEYNRRVCAERPWNGYLLSPEIVKQSIELQVNSLSESRKAEFVSLIKGPALKEAELVYYSDTKCQFNRKRFFFPRLSVKDEAIGNTQGGYTIRVGNDIEEACS